MKSFFLSIIVLLSAMAAQAQQDPFAPRRCLHSIDNTISIWPTGTNGMKHAMSTSTADGLGSYGKSANGSVKSIGEHAIPVIMVEFADLKFNAGTTEEKVTRLFNEHGYSDEANCVGSVRDYFLDNSDGMFSPSFEVVAKVTVANGVSYYGSNSGSNHNVKIKSLVTEAVGLAENAGVDFAQYKEGTSVPMVLIYYAGQGENACFDSDKDKYIWPHFSNYSFESSVDKVQINSYYAGNEWRKNYALNSSNQIVVTSQGIDGIGVLIHELMHALGLPDFYPTNGKTYETPDWWSVMDYGEYYCNSYRPVGLTAYEKSYLGWLDVQELDNEQAVSLEAGQAAVVRTSTNSNEYYLIENRQDDLWHPAELPLSGGRDNGFGTGLLIMHVDYNATDWSKNQLNNTQSHLRMHVLQANGKWTGVAADDFTFAELRTNLYGYAADGPTSIVGADWKNYTGTVQPIYDIEQLTDEMSSIRFSYVTEGLATAISSAKAEGKDAAVYTLDGRRVARPANGLYIVGGKKVVVK